MGTSISTLGQSMSQTERIKQQQLSLANLQLQLSTGKKTDRFSGLGAAGIISQRARADLNAVELYNNNITIANRRIKTMIDSVEEFKAQAENVANVIAGQIQDGEIDLKIMNDLASNILPFMEDLINTKDNERYVFSGASTNTKPLSFSSGTLETYFYGQLVDWQDDLTPAVTTDTLMASYKNVPETIIGYNADISSGRTGKVLVRADKTLEIDYTTSANESGFKDVMIATQFLKQITNTDPSSPYYIDKIKLEESDYAGVNNIADLPITPPPHTSSDIFTNNGVPPAAELDFTDPAVRADFAADNQARADNFFRIINDLGTMINNAIDGLDQIRYALESDRARLSEIKTSHTYDIENLKNTIGDVEDVDTTEVAMALSFQQIQLEASFRITAAISELSLAKFL